MAFELKFTQELTYVNEKLLYDQNFKRNFLELESTKKEFIQINNAYHRVENISGDKSSISFDVVIYKDIKAANDKKNALQVVKLKFIPDQSENSIRWDKQCYDYAKSLELFKGSIDC